MRFLSTLPLLPFASLPGLRAGGSGFLTALMMLVLVHPLGATEASANAIVSSANGFGAEHANDGSFDSQLPGSWRFSQLELVGDEIWATGVAEVNGILLGSARVVRFDTTSYSLVGDVLSLPSSAADILFTGSEVLITNEFSPASRFALDGTFLGFATSVPRFAQLELVGDEIWATGSIDGGILTGGSGLIRRFDATTYAPLADIVLPAASGDLLFTGSEVVVTLDSGGAKRYAPDGSFLGDLAIPDFSQLELVGDEMWATGSIRSDGVLLGSGDILRYDASSYAFLGSFAVEGGALGGDVLSLPEPGTALLIGSACLALAARRRLAV